MSWIMKLYETYVSCSELVGKTITEDVTPLLPVFHTTQNAQIQVTIDEKGNYLSGEVLDKGSGVTIIPCSEDSASRSGKYPVCHPLFDKLQYLAGDYSKHGGEKGDQFYKDYIEQLSDWCISLHGNVKVKAILNYLKKGTLINDLISSKVLVCDENGMLMEKWNGDKNNAPAIFKACQGNQSDAFVRFRVYLSGEGCSDIWKDQKMYHDFIGYYSSRLKDRDLCYASGQWIPVCEKHPSRIRNSADKAKLISANDESGFTYRGRFTDKNQAVTIGSEVSQKAHNALKWLIEKQGWVYDGKAILAWGAENQKLPPILEDTVGLLEILTNEEEKHDLTDENFAKRLNSAIAGYRCDLKHSSDVMIMALDGATTGRLSITFYRELKGDQFLERIESWHKKCCWKHHYRTSDKNRIFFIGAPAPKDIALAAYGAKANEKLIRSTIERLLPCIVDGVALPEDIVASTVRRASNPVSMETREWQKTLSIACALYRKNYKKEELNMSLDETKTDRSYLYGRLLAVADQIENLTYEKWGERTTNAMRYMNVFSQKPFKTWAIIAKNLIPYQEKLGERGVRYNNLLDQIGSMIDYEDFKSDKPLDGLYLLGYYCQKQYFFDQIKTKISQNQTSSDIA